MLSPLDKVCAAGKSNDKVVWTVDLEEAFQKAKDHLQRAEILNAATTSAGLGASMYVIRGKKAHLAGVFNARKTSSQAGWLICELEALGIAAAVKHFSPYITQSLHTTEVLTDSRPCVQSYHELQKGAFSTSVSYHLFINHQ
jgi:hypothetical protein